MKNCRKITSIWMITFLAGSLALAQPRGNQGPPSLPSDKQISKMVKELDKELELSDEQQEKVSDLYFAHFETVEAKMKSSKRPDRSEMEALDSKLEKEVKAVLDEDQQKLYTAYLKEKEKERSAQRPQGGQRPPR